MNIQLKWNDLPSLHKGGAISTHLLTAWIHTHVDPEAETHEKQFNNPVTSATERLSLERGMSWARLGYACVSVCMLMIATTTRLQIPPAVSVVTFCLLVAILTPSGRASAYYYDWFRKPEKFSADLSRLCNHFGKTPAALAQMDEQALKNLATRFLKAAAEEVAKLDPKSTWSSQVEAHEKMRNDFRDLFDFLKSFGLTEQGGYALYFPHVNPREPEFSSI